MVKGLSRYKEISIHAPRVGCDMPSERYKIKSNKFQSTHPVWGATCRRCARTARNLFQSTHPVWGATWAPISGYEWGYISIHAPRVGCDRSSCRLINISDEISIHAPRVGCDLYKLALHFFKRISIHAPRVGCDLFGGVCFGCFILFQSTHPVWGATSLLCAANRRMGNFNPRTPCGVRPQSLGTKRPHREFQSTHPVWGATP